MFLFSVFDFLVFNHLDYAKLYKAPFITVGNVCSIVCGSYGGNIGVIDVFVGLILLACFRERIVSGFRGGVTLAAELGFMLSGGFGFGYSSMRIHLLHFAMRVFRLHHSSNSPQNCGPLSVLMLSSMP